MLQYHPLQYHLRYSTPPSHKSAPANHSSPANRVNGDGPSHVEPGPSPGWVPPSGPKPHLAVCVCRVQNNTCSFFLKKKRTLLVTRRNMHGWAIFGNGLSPREMVEYVLLLTTFLRCQDCNRIVGCNPLQKSEDSLLPNRLEAATK